MFDPSAPHIIILAAVVLLLFGSRRLPGAAKSLGQSMHIFKRSVRGLDEDDQSAGDSQFPQATVVQQPPAPQPLAAPAVNATQQQLDDIQRQVQELQRLSASGNAVASGGTTSAEPPQNQQSN